MEYRPYAEVTGRPHVVVDGSAQAGTDLVLSHWPGAATPAILRADLSAEIAFKYLDHPELHVDAPYVTNNHFDQDGLVSVFALVEPEAAQARRERLVDIARAGDFSTFRDRDAARAALTMAHLGNVATDDPYRAVLPRLVEVVDDVGRFRTVWADEDAHITETERAIETGTIGIETRPDLDLAIVTIPSAWAQRTVHQFTTTRTDAAHPMAINNAIDEYAVVTIAARAPELQYRYETWVHLTSRRPRPRVDLADLATRLTREDRGPGHWTFDGVTSLSPALHLVRSAETTITADRFIELVTDELSAAVVTWSPYDG
ncbi:MAG: hypothetical protein JJE46_02270 [Acidimicrobiia bacterium]|nr:hypothetical protein [Acidimicrobiia bacterium]